MPERDAGSQITATLLTGVDATYRHSSKRATPDATLRTPEIALKWYLLAPDPQPVPESIRRVAREFVEAELRDSRLQARGLGFTILHRCGESFYFLIVNTWQNSNEIWESVYYKDGDAMPGFAPFPREGPHKPAFCVWELGPVWHEQQAWSRFLSSRRTESDVERYLEDRFDGTV